MGPIVKLYMDQRELLSDHKRYHHLVGKLNYLSITSPDISFAISVVSRYMAPSRLPHLEAVIQIVRCHSNSEVS